MSTSGANTKWIWLLPGEQQVDRVVKSEALAEIFRLPEGQHPDSSNFSTSLIKTTITGQLSTEFFREVRINSEDGQHHGEDQGDRGGDEEDAEYEHATFEVA
jgi:hypothetical protein